MPIVTPITYCDVGKFAQQHALSFLERFGHLLTWKSEVKEVVADIGCANGVLTTDVLLPYCQTEIQEIVGIDISKEMIQLANEKNKTPNARFLEMDISKKNIGDKLVDKFHHIFSFYCIHMIADQRQCAENFYKMLQPGGEVFLTLMFRNNMIQVWYDLCESDKWSEYLVDFPKNFSTYQTSDRPLEDFESVFRGAGFEVEMHVERTPHMFADREKFDGFLVAMNYLNDFIPGNLQDEFRKDLLGRMYSETGGDNELVMDVLVGIARKPLI